MKMLKLMYVLLYPFLVILLFPVALLFEIIKFTPMYFYEILGDFNYFIAIKNCLKNFKKTY